MAQELQEYIIVAFQPHFQHHSLHRRLLLIRCKHSSCGLLISTLGVKGFTGRQGVTGVVINGNEQFLLETLRPRHLYIDPDLFASPQYESIAAAARLCGSQPSMLN